MRQKTVLGVRSKAPKPKKTINKLSHKNPKRRAAAVPPKRRSTRQIEGGDDDEYFTATPELLRNTAINSFKHDEDPTEDDIAVRVKELKTREEKQRYVAIMHNQMLQFQRLLPVFEDMDDAELGDLEVNEEDDEDDDDADGYKSAYDLLNNIQADDEDEEDDENYVGQEDED
eukprot:TRINITY_DN5799_c0_g1_i1.p1 TRINITY_DN5799_c0_g1~~TRINITY_DN5799_c0_g1_i1.p1  ORF type:complete len:172 (-),score=64.88 TRINITY_DN5799_c0_g1_i1:21-536(-)